MIDGPFDAMILLAIVGCGAMGGVFFAFSAFVMNALVRLPPAQGIAAMQSIDVAAVTPPFMTALFGTALLCLALIVGALRDWRMPASVFVLAGGLLYLVGVIVVTMICNVPRNDALAAVAPAADGAAAVWTQYVSEWTIWNSVRAAAGLVAAAAFTLGLVAALTAR